jgi:hypothetical protein
LISQNPNSPQKNGKNTDFYEYFRTANTALCPPKPKALLMASEIFPSRALFGM